MKMPAQSTFQIKYDWDTEFYSVELQHARLQKYRSIRGRDESVVKQKARLQQKAWNAQWEKQLSKIANQRKVESKTEQARKRTKEAKAELDTLRNLLVDALKRNPMPDFEKLKKQKRFQSKAFTKPAPEIQTKQIIFIPEPKRPIEPINYGRPLKDGSPQSREEEKGSNEYTAALAAWEQEKAVWEREKYAAALAAWEQRREEIHGKNRQRQIAHETQTAKMQAAFEKSHAAWRQEKESFELKHAAVAKSLNEQHKAHKSQLNRLELMYAQKTREGIVEYCRLVLSQSDYPRQFPRKFELDYQSDAKLLLVEYSFPAIDVLPAIVEVDYQPTKGEFKEVSLPNTSLKKLYDDVLYQITLRSLFELFKADRATMVDSIVFNGWVHALNRATGKKMNTCVLSVHASRTPFQNLDLKNVDPKACFRLLKGVGSSELHGLAAIAPIMRINKSDKRFIDDYGVAEGLDGAVNLAAMNWEDFEHLVRELFEKEFAQYGGEVKITQASRDGGVDAVAFDPDPIRGGKIVIQAKRYTNVVELSAVRDLYGTVVNEGAIKGILVTTADYGPDAYEFAKNKPLTLLNGANLLHMLERHGHKAKIDLREAKRVLAQESRR